VQFLFFLSIVISADASNCCDASLVLSAKLKKMERKSPFDSSYNIKLLRIIIPHFFSA